MPDSPDQTNQSLNDLDDRVVLEAAVDELTDAVPRLWDRDRRLFQDAVEILIHNAIVDDDGYVSFLVTPIQAIEQARRDRLELHLFARTLAPRPLVVAWRPQLRAGRFMRSQPRCRRTTRSSSRAGPGREPDPEHHDLAAGRRP